ncbi:hypothetical protein [Proteiniclasticum ruminis]|uniref:Uncharacterized protein n=1 Tax=Proteiniclasticum ruminis TaxID=398199 RepID=A0A1G8PAH9_9CLOT|nr:hypothetical protein [Proteiniclasticum ruminis]SDI89318.1 hypothetical protein SAMN05421804_10539 [Proteiniclasticum ruminis]
MAVRKEKELEVNVPLEKAFQMIEAEFRKKQETVMEERELTETAGFFKIFFKKSMVSNGEYLTVNLEKLDEEKLKLSMVSESKVEKTVHDWGKNEKNMRLILEILGVVKKDEKKGVYYPGRR